MNKQTNKTSEEKNHKSSLTDTNKKFIEETKIALNKKVKQGETIINNKLGLNRDIEFIQIPILDKILSILCIAQCVVSAPIAYKNILNFIRDIKNGLFDGSSTSITILYAIFLLGMLGLIVCLIGVGINLLLKKRKRAAVFANICFICVFIAAICDLMIVGFKIDILILTITAIILVVLQSYLNPTLSKERKEHRKKKYEKTKSKAEKGNLGFSDKDKHMIRLDYFNIF